MPLIHKTGINVYSSHDDLEVSQSKSKCSGFIHNVLLWANVQNQTESIDHPSSRKQITNYTEIPREILTG